MGYNAFEADNLQKVDTLTTLKESKPYFSIVASLAFCLLVGCGGGGGGSASTTSSRTPDPAITPEPPDTSRIVKVITPAPLDGSEPEEPTGDDEPDVVMPPSDPVIPLPTKGLLNRAELNLVKAPQAWESDEKPGGYTGKGVVVGIMEEVNPFHVVFGSGDNSKIHPDSILTSPYPTNLPPPPNKYIADNVDELVMNDKSQTGSDRMKKYPQVPCLLQFDDIDDCPDTSGGTKYFLRLAEGGLGVLPGLIDPNPDEHECPMFVLEEDGEPEEICPNFSGRHGVGVAGILAANKGKVTINIREYGRNKRYSSNYQGIAYDAQILLYASHLNLAGFIASFEEHADSFRNAPATADVYNFSSSYGVPVDQGDGKAGFINEYHEKGFSKIAEAIRGMSQPLIVSSGNDYEKLPRFPGALPYFFPDLRGKILAVTAVDENGSRLWYANKCGLLPADWNTEKHGRHYCLAAPGGESLGELWLPGPDNEEFGQGKGTSYAAPFVTGAFAILKERFRNKDETDGLSDKELILRLVNTANNTNCKDIDNYRLCHNYRKIGKYEYLYEIEADLSDVALYGAGLLDIEAAIMPVGTQRMSAFGDINGGITYEFDVTSLTTSAAFGDALQRAFQVHEVAAFDELDAPFWYPLSSLTPTTSSRETLQERRARLFEQDIAPVETAIGGKLALTSTHAGSSRQIDMSLRQPVDIPAAQMELLLTAGDLSTAPFGLHEDKSFAHPYLHFADEGIGLGGAVQLGTGQLTAMGFTSSSANVARDIPINAHGGLLEYAIEPFAGVEFGVQTGVITEESRALGLLSEGGFGELGESSTTFAGVSLDGELEDSWRFRASMLFGRTNLDEPSIGLLKTSSTLTSSAFRFALEGSDVLMDADRMDVFVGQPLRIENGKADFSVPVGRTPSGLVKREQINGVSLEPGGRELEFGARYEMQVREDITVTGGIGIVHEGGHSKHTETELYGLANLRFQF